MKLKFIHRVTLFSLFTAGLLLAGCMKDSCKEVQKKKAYVPVYRSYEEFREDITTGSPRPIKEPGKIFVKNEHLLINERNKGIHVVDNSDPKDPKRVSFISIPGNIDLSMQGDVLYADSYMDLVVLDLSHPTNPQTITRLKEVFPYDPYQYTPYEGRYVKNVDSSKGVVVDWQLKTVKAERPCGEQRIAGRRQQQRFFHTQNTASNGSGSSNVSYSSSSGSSVKSTISKSGSMSRFATTASEHLYTVKGEELGVFDINDPRNPSHLTDRTIGPNIETIFAYKENLFIGANDGMHIFDISDPSSPSFTSTYEHVRQCDPVVVQKERAYLTIRSNGPCGGWQNELRVIDVSDPSSPYEEATYEMEAPHGLDIRDTSLYVCNGDAGLKAFDASETPDLVERSSITAMHGYDVIALPKKLIVTGEDGIFQYDRSQGLDQLQRLSSMQVHRY